LSPKRNEPFTPGGRKKNRHEKFGKKRGGEPKDRKEAIQGIGTRKVQQGDCSRKRKTRTSNQNSSREDQLGPKSYWMKRGKVRRLWAGTCAGKKRTAGEKKRKSLGKGRRNRQGGKEPKNTRPNPSRTLSTRRNLGKPPERGPFTTEKRETAGVVQTGPHETAAGYANSPTQGCPMASDGGKGEPSRRET